MCQDPNLAHTSSLASFDGLLAGFCHFHVCSDTACATIACQHVCYSLLTSHKNTLKCFVSSRVHAVLSSFTACMCCLSSISRTSDNHYQCCSDCVRVASWLQLLRMGSGPSNIAALLCRALQAQQHCRCAQCTFSAMACSVCCIGTSPTNRSMCCCPVQSATVPSKMQHQNTYTEPILLSQSMETVSGSCCSARAPLKVFCLHPGHLHSAVICSQARLCRSWFRYWDQVGLCGCSTFIAVLLCHGDSSTTQILLPQS